MKISGDIIGIYPLPVKLALLYITAHNKLQDKILQKITKNEKKYQKSDYNRYERRVCRVNRYFSRVYATRIAGTENVKYIYKK